MSRISAQSVIYLHSVILAILLTGGCLQEQRPDSISLESLNWEVVSGFQKEYTRGLPAEAQQQAKRVQSFPVLLNRILEIPTGDELVHSTMQTRFSLNPDQLNQPMGIHFPWIGEAWELYVNGHLVENQLILNNPTELKYRKIYRHLTLPLNNATLRAGENILTIHFAGYQHPTPFDLNGNHGLIFAGGYEIAPLSYLERVHTDTLRIVLSTVYLFFGLYHLVIFSRRNQDRYNLFFGLFCFALALDSVTGTLQLHRTMTETAWINRIKYFSQMVEIPLFFYFVHTYFFSERKTPVILTVFAWIFYTIAFLTMAVPFPYTELMLKAFHYSAVPALLYSIYFIGKVILSRRRDSLLFGMSILVLIASGFWGIVDSEFFHTGVHLVPYGFLFCILSLIFILANRFLTVHNESERLNVELTEQKNAFHRFVPTQFLNHLGRESAVDVQVGDSVLREMTVLFCDIRSFTTLSEGSGPQETFSLLNDHLRQMEPCIYRQGGFVDKYVGDAILSLFSDDNRGSGEGSTRGMNSAQRAVSAAIEMARLARSAQSLRDGNQGFLPGFGIGINSGDLVLGTVGSPARIDTTVIGDTVNTCSRLESLTIHYKCPILVSGSTMEKLGKDIFHARQVDEVYLRGKKQSTRIFEIFDADPPEQLLEKSRIQVRYNEAMELYRTGDFAAALKLFSELHQKAPSDQILPLYIERIKGLQENASTLKDWDGTIPVLGS